MEDKIYIKKRRMREVREHGCDILKSSGMRAERNWIQHGRTSVYHHSIRVAILSLQMAEFLNLSVDKRALIRGALLHDYFLYDWHEKDASHKWHGFHHAKKACNNAMRDFEISDLESDIIEKHMFPLNRSLPRYRESQIVCVADKICSVAEIADGIRRL